MCVKRVGTTANTSALFWPAEMAATQCWLHYGAIIAIPIATNCVVFTGYKIFFLVLAAITWKLFPAA